MQHTNIQQSTDPSASEIDSETAGDTIRPKIWSSSNEVLLIVAQILTTDVQIRFLSNPRKSSLLYSVLLWVYGFLNQCGGLLSSSLNCRKNAEKLNSLKLINILSRVFTSKYFRAGL